MEEIALVEIVYHVAVSIDGYLATPEGGVAWLPVPDREGEDYGYSQFYDSVDGLLMGRNTYEKCLEFEWPYAGKPCWVFSRRSLEVEQPDVTVTTLHPHEMMTDLATHNLQRVWLVGGGQLATSFRKEGLISEYLIALIPTILGQGIPFLVSSQPQEKLKLVEHQLFSGGVVLLRYQQEPEEAVDFRL